MIIICILCTFGIVFFCTICIIIGGNKNKTEYEKELEDIEQIEYLKNYSKHKKEV